MKIVFLSVGKNHDPMLSVAIDAYTARVNRYNSVSWKLLPVGSASDEVSMKKQEGDLILKNLEESDYVVVLDEKGKEYTTVDLSVFLEKRLNAGEKQLVFVIGGAYGFDQRVVERADMLWSLSKLTFPHQLVRLILSESIYRAFSFLKGEPYHHA